jgi:transposase
MTRLYIGIDIGKNTHVAAFLSQQLLSTQHFSTCPLIRVEQSRTGFTHLLKEICKYAHPEDCHILLEHTGHYGQALEQFLQEHGAHLYRIQTKGRYGRDKTDERDARALAVMLYNQEELKATIIDEKQRIHRLVPPSDAARTLRGLVRHRYELSSESTQRKNKLTSIADELFPELTQVYLDPNNASALQLRDKFPLPSDIANAEIADLCATRLRSQPSRVRLIHLQELARTSIGTKDKSRQYSLLIEQRQLIAELQVMNRHIAKLEVEIESIVTTSREGQIISSFIGSGPIQAATLLASLGNIANFASASKLRGYVGWAPKQSQTGSSQDSIALGKSGNVLLKRTMFLITICAVRYDPTWKALYTRLVERKCSYDARTRKYRGKMKVIGRIAGQIIQVMYTLLKKDHDLVAGWNGVEPLPSPTLYDPEKHRVESRREK